MAYKLFDVNGSQITHHNLQDKGVWCRDGATEEEVFVENYGEKLGLIVNPDKRINPYVPDLVNTKNDLLADLKTQNTPFFQAQTRFGFTPQYAVVFNEKDRLRYSNRYPEIEIYFWVDWQAVRFVGNTEIKVQPMTGIWFIPFKKLDQVLQNSPLHHYAQRRNDRQGNAKSSRVLSVQHTAFTKIV